jgi:2-dehydro-3-deoxy-D-arabinonate dehydratase
LLDANFNLPDLRAIDIQLQIQRNGKLVFDGKASTATMKRHVDDLVSWLFRELDFPYGAFLMSGTGIVPDLPYTLVSGDVVSISMSGLGTLTNTVR